MNKLTYSLGCIVVAMLVTGCESGDSEPGTQTSSADANSDTTNAQSGELIGTWTLESMDIGGVTGGSVGGAGVSGTFVLRADGTYTDTKTVENNSSTTFTGTWSNDATTIYLGIANNQGTMEVTYSWRNGGMLAIDWMPMLNPSTLYIYRRQN